MHRNQPKLGNGGWWLLRGLWQAVPGAQGSHGGEFSFGDQLASAVTDYNCGLSMSA